MLEKAPEEFQVYKLKREQDKLYVSSEQLKHIEHILENYEQRLTEQVHPQGYMDPSSKVPLANDMMIDLLTGQGYYKGQRETYAKLNDFVNSKKNWKENTNNTDGHDGLDVFKGIKNVFTENDILVSDIEFSSTPFIFKNFQ